MSLLFAMPNFAASTELWMERTIGVLEPHISYVAAGNANSNFWNNVKIIDITRQSVQKRITRRLKILSGLKVDSVPCEVLKSAVSSKKVEKVVTNYLGWSMNYKEAWAKEQKPLYIQCHGYDVFDNLISHNFPFLAAHIDGYRDEVKSFQEQVTCFIANSVFTANKLINLGVDEKRIKVKYYGFPVPSTNPQLRKNPKDPFTILFLGRLVDFKGPDKVIKAFELASANGLDGQLLLAGDGPLMIYCKMLIEESPYRSRMKLIGMVNSKEGEKLRNSASIFAAHNCKGTITNQEEAFGASVVEAMAAGLPVVSGRSGALEETVVHGESGYLVEPGNIEAQAEAFLELYNDQEHHFRMSRAAFKRANFFSVEKESDSLKEILGLNN